MYARCQMSPFMNQPVKTRDDADLALYSNTKQVITWNKHENKNQATGGVKPFGSK